MLRCRPTQSGSDCEPPMLIEPYAARPHIKTGSPREKSGRRSRPPLSNVVQEQSGRRHLHRLFGLRNVVSANDRHASGLAQLARGRPPAAEMIAETKWDDHAVLSCAAYNQCRPAHDLHSSAQIGERESRVLPAAGVFWQLVSSSQWDDPLWSRRLPITRPRTSDLNEHLF